MEALDKQLALVFGLFVGFVENKKSTEYHRTYSFNPETVFVEISWDPVPTKERLLAKKETCSQKTFRRPCGLLKREVEERRRGV